MLACPFCGRKTSHFGSLLNHVRKKHPLGNVCPVCGEKSSNLVSHFHSTGKQCELHVLLFVCYARKPSRYKDLVEVAMRLLESGVRVGGYKTKVIDGGRIFYSVYDGGRVRIKSLVNGKVITTSIERLKRLYDEFPEKFGVKDCVRVCKRMGFRFGKYSESYKMLAKVAMDMFGGRYVKGCFSKGDVDVDS